MHEVPDAVLVIAWGNPLREDDGVAWHVVEGLRRLQPRPSLPLLRLRHAHQQLTPELAEPVSHAAGVVFVDARRDGTPGQVLSRGRVSASGRPEPARALAQPPGAPALRRGPLRARAAGRRRQRLPASASGWATRCRPRCRRALPRAIRTDRPPGESLEAQLTLAMTRPQDRRRWPIRCRRRWSRCQPGR